MNSLRVRRHPNETAFDALKKVFVQFALLGSFANEAIFQALLEEDVMVHLVHKAWQEQVDTYIFTLNLNCLAQLDHKK